MIFAIRQFCLPFLSDSLEGREHSVFRRIKQGANNQHDQLRLEEVWTRQSRTVLSTHEP